MEQQYLWHDSLEEALEAVVVAMGGPKKAGTALWPAKTPADAARLLRHCLDPERPEKLALEDLMHLLKAGRKANCHTAVHFINTASGYTAPQVLNPEDEQAQLQREFIQAMKKMDGLTKRLHACQLRAVGND